MLMPKRTKFRKQHRGRRRGLAKGQQQVNFGDYGLKSLEAGCTRLCRGFGRVLLRRIEGQMLPTSSRVRIDVAAAARIRASW